MKFTVERSKWFRGHGNVDSRMLRDDGKMCCLGFSMLANGCEEKDILDKGFPSSVDANRFPLSLRWLYSNSLENRELPEESIAFINDIERMPELEREEKLKQEFSKYGHEIEFVD